MLLVFLALLSAVIRAVQEIDELSGGAVPMRVVCTGYGIGAT